MPVTILRCADPACAVTVQMPTDGGGSLECPRCRKPLQAVAQPTPSPGQRETRELPDSGPPMPARVGRFEVKRFVGKGGFGRVYEADDPVLKRRVALKIPLPERADTPEKVQRFQREAQSAAQLQHPHIVAVFDSGQDGPHHYIASAFVEGDPLDKLIRDNPKGVAAKKAAGIVRKLAEALAYAHKKGMVHRDVKPGNVMLSADGEPLLMDFGLASRSEPGEERLTQGQAAMGSPPYMAPEQGRGDAVEASDQYSLGVTLYELLTGRLPFDGGDPVQFRVLHEMEAPPSLRSIRKDLPRDLEAVCLKCLEKEPCKRYGELPEAGRRPAALAGRRGRGGASSGRGGADGPLGAAEAGRSGAGGAAAGADRRRRGGGGDGRLPHRRVSQRSARKREGRG